MTETMEAMGRKDPVARMVSPAGTSTETEQEISQPKT